MIYANKHFSEIKAAEFYQHQDLLQQKVVSHYAGFRRKQPDSVPGFYNLHQHRSNVCIVDFCKGLGDEL